MQDNYAAIVISIVALIFSVIALVFATHVGNGRDW
jgi:hypothetical protein